MKVLNVLLGIFAVLAAFSLLCFPGLTFLKAGWIAAIVLCVWGVCALILSLTKKTSKGAATTLLNVLIAVLGGAAIAAVSVLAMNGVITGVILDMVAVWIFTFWLIFSGFSSIVAAFKILKPQGGGRWLFTLIMGVLTLVLGLYGIFHIVLMAQTIGALLGFMLMLYGVRLITTVFEK